VRLVVTGRQLDVTPALRERLERKLAKLERLLNDSVVSVQVVLWLEKQRHITDLQAHVRGDHMLSALGEGRTWPASMTDAVDKVLQQAYTLKEKWQTRKRRAIGARGQVRRQHDRAAARTAAARGSFVRVARYPVKPMSVDDAAVRLERSQEDFVLFRDAHSDRLAVLYRRRDGRVALIDPEG